MKQLIRTMGILALVFFILGFLVTVYYTYFLMPNQLMEALELEGKDKLELIKSAITPTLVVIFVELILGFLIIVSMISRQNSYNIKDMLETILEENQAQIYHSEQKVSTESTFDQKIVTKFIEEADQINEQKSQKIFNLLCHYTKAVAGALYVARYDEKKRYLELKESFAFQVSDKENLQIAFGEGIAGQVAKEQQATHIKNVPSDYLKIISGLGQSSDADVFLVPISSEKKLILLAEIASFEKNQPQILWFIAQVLEKYKTVFI